MNILQDSRAETRFSGIRTASQRIAAPILAAFVLCGCPTHRLMEKTPVMLDVDLESLEKAHFDELLQHVLPEGLVVYMRRDPGTLRELYRQAASQADGAYFNGCMLAMLSFKYAATGDLEALDLALKAFDAHHFLVSGSGYPGLVARSFGKMRPSDPGYVFRKDSSGDALSGWLFGTSVFLRHIDDPARKSLAAEDLRAIVRHMRKHDLKIHSSENEPTPYGYFKRPVFLVPIGHRAAAMMALSPLALAANPADSDCLAFRAFLEEKGYPGQCGAFYSWFPHHADNSMMYVMNLLTALMNDTSTRNRAFYLQGMEEFWERVHDWQMAFFGLAYKYSGGASEPDSMRDSIERLRNVPRRYRQTSGEDGGDRRRGSIVPIERRPMTSSYWAQNPWIESADPAGDPGPVSRCRLDFLLAYWFGRCMGEYEPAGEGPGRPDESPGPRGIRTGSISQGRRLP